MCSGIYLRNNIYNAFNICTYITYIIYAIYICYDVIYIMYVIYIYVMIYNALNISSSSIKRKQHQEALHAGAVQYPSRSSLFKLVSNAMIKIIEGSWGAICQSYARPSIQLPASLAR